jgi:two-component system, NtrC family, sensor kinase
MKRRSKAGGGPIKRRRPRTPKPTRRNAPKVEIRSKPSPFAEEKEVALLARERDQALEQQTAASEVLRVIRASPGELELVFQAMLERAVRLCEAKFGNIYRWDGEALHILASHNTPPAFAEAVRRSPYRPYANSPIGRMVASRTVAHINDVTAEEVYLAQRDPIAMSAVALGGIRTLLGVPLLNKGQMIGAFFLSRQEVRPFTEKQIALVQNFADQAVIAIENARLLNELRQSLKQQTATADVLKVISRSTFDLQPVLDALVETAAKLCAADMASIATRDGEVYRVKANYALNPEWNALVRTLSFRPGRDTVTGRTLLERQTVQIADITTDPEYALSAAASVGKIRTVIGVPLLREGDPTGVMQLARSQNEPFTERQIELIRTFADQAAIAIENARLLNELRQSLEQQTATSKVLQVISSSPGALQPVFDAMLTNATRLCEASFGILLRYENAAFHVAASHNAPPAFVELRRREPTIRASGVLRRVVATKQLLHISDCLEDASYKQGDADFVRFVDLCGARSFIAAPMLKDDELVGTITVFHQEVRPFTDKQIELVKNFAAQAVIAIENARLLNELRQRTGELETSLEYQTATSDVLKVISRSVFDLQKILEFVAETAARLCGAKQVAIYLLEDHVYRFTVSFGLTPAYRKIEEALAIEPGPETLVGRVALSGEPVHILDCLSDPNYGPKDDIRATQVHTLLGVPLTREGKVVGDIALAREPILPFSSEQIELVRTFADQAVIAIENARLLKELRERTDQLQMQSQELAKLNQDLERRVADQVGEIERMGRLRRFLPPQVADLIVASGTEKQLESHRREITALFCDLRGFTGFTESADAEDVMALLRDYHATVGEKIIKYSGTLERYAGDGVMVVFNDPVPVENPALQAVLMALEMRDAIGALTETWGRLGHEIGFGIGIAHGFATLGTIGFEGRFDYAAIGTVSNVASRLCDEAKPGQILISPRVLMKVENAVKVEPVGEFELKGIRRPLAAYNVVGLVSARSLDAQS